MQQERSPSRFLKPNFTYAVFFLAFILTSVLLYGVYFYFQVKRVEVITVSDQRKIIGLERLHNKNLLLVSEKELKNPLIEANPNVRDLRVEKIYPNSLKIYVQFEKGLAALSVDQGYFVLSAQARVLSKVKKQPTGLPAITYYQKLHYTDYQTGDPVDLKDIIVALHFLKKVRELGLRVLNVDINGFNMIRLQLENKMILFTTEKKIQDQDYELEVLIRQFKIEGKDFKTLDFRFEKPIVTLR